MSSSFRSKVNPFEISQQQVSAHSEYPGDERSAWEGDWGSNGFYEDEHGGDGHDNNHEEHVGLIGLHRYDDDEYDYQDENAFHRTPYGRSSGRDIYGQHARQGRGFPSPNDGKGANSNFFLIGFLLFILVLLAWSGANHSNDNEESFHSLKDIVPTQHLVVIGERHSGVPWMFQKLNECYPNAYISTSLQRIGYFFQEDETSQQHNSIVIHVTLNVYDWLERMRFEPEYMPAHRQAKNDETGYETPLPWKAFLETPWTLPERPARDLPYENSTDSICQLEYPYHRVMSCLEDPAGVGKDNPIYELKANGEPFSSILELRAAKLRNHHSVSSWKTVRGRIAIQYDALTNPGYFQEELLDEIHRIAPHLQSHCSGAHALVLPPSLQHTSSMSRNFVNYVNEHVQWDAESLVGYKEPWGEKEMTEFDLPWETSETTTKGKDADISPDTTGEEQSMDNSQASSTFDMEDGFELMEQEPSSIVDDEEVDQNATSSILDDGGRI